MRTSLLRSFAVVLAVGCVASLAEREARACGGCFHPPDETGSVITDHRMILSISSQQTTLYDQIRYQGTPSSFAWVLPISGEATIGLSADVVFASLDSTTSVAIHAPFISCPQPPYQGCPGDHGGSGSAADASAPAQPPVTVVKEETVGPYETVQLQADDPNALLDWLSSHGFTIPDDVKPIITAYTNEHFGFLAMKLVPGANVQAMRPVRVTTAGASPTLPLRMVAAGTGAVVGMTLWVIGEGRYEPQNFPTFTMSTDGLVWDFNTQLSNYTTKRATAEAAFDGRGWQIESSLPQQIDLFKGLVRSGGQYPYAPPAPAANDYDPQTADGGVTKTPDQVRDEDLATLFQGMSPASVRVTRLRSDLAHSALATDLILRASTDQGILQRDLYVTQSVNAPACPPIPPPPVCEGDTSDSGAPPIFGPIYGGPFKVPTGGGGTASPSNGKESFSCASIPGETDGSGSGLALMAIAGFFTVAVARSRRRR